MLLSLSLRSAMAAVLDLNALNKSSAKLATFTVALSGGRVFEYSYQQKKDGKRIIAHRFEVYLVGMNGESYCIGFVKASHQTCKQAADKYKDGSICHLSKAFLDTYTAANYISTPVLFRVDLQKSTLNLITDLGGAPQPAMHPIPPRSVADVACINTAKTTDLLALVKSVTRDRKSKDGHSIADVELLDDSKIGDDKLAIVTVSVFGSEKLRTLTAAIGSPMVFFNLSVSCSSGRTSISHYADDVIVPAPACAKTTLLTSKHEELSKAENVESLTTAFVPNNSKDVSGPQVLSCAAFLDFTRDNKDARTPDVVQLMWVHIEEPDAAQGIKDASGTRIWYLAQLRDVSGATTVGMPERIALRLASCTSAERFIGRHADNSLNMPLLCHVRLSKSTRTSDSGVVFINYIVEEVAEVSYELSSAPNAAYEDLVKLLNMCPAHNEGIVFAYLSDIQTDPHYGFKVAYDDVAAPRSAHVLSFVAATEKSSTLSIGEGFQVTTLNVLDFANPAGAAQPSYTLLGYCSVDALPGFRMDPPRGRSLRYAMCLLTKREDATFYADKLEYIEPDQVDNAVRCFRKLRSLCQRIQPVTSEKRSGSVAACSDTTTALQKRSRTLCAVPTDVSME